MCAGEIKVKYIKFFAITMMFFLNSCGPHETYTKIIKNKNNNLDLTIVYDPGMGAATSAIYLVYLSKSQEKYSKSDLIFRGSDIDISVKWIGGSTVAIIFTEGYVDSFRGYWLNLDSKVEKYRHIEIVLCQRKFCNIK